MAKKMSLFAFLAIGILGFLIWQDPNGAGDIVKEFFSMVGDVLAQAWDKIGDFFSSVANG